MRIFQLSCLQQDEDDGSPKEIRVLVNQGIVGGIIGKVNALEMDLKKLNDRMIELFGNVSCHSFVKTTF